MTICGVAIAGAIFFVFLVALTIYFSVAFALVYTPVFLYALVQQQNVFEVQIDELPSCVFFPIYAWMVIVGGAAAWCAAAIPPAVLMGFALIGHRLFDPSATQLKPIEMPEAKVDVEAAVDENVCA